MKKTSFFFLFLLLASASSAGAIDITVAANAIVHDSYIKWHEKQHCLDINDFTEMTSHRAEVEMLLICKALHRGGLTPRISIIEVSNYSRALLESQQGRYTMPAETIWDSDIDESDFYVSDPIIDNIELGIYTTPEHKDLLKVRSLKQLQMYRAVSSINWVKDWSTLQAMGIDTHNVSTQNLMFKFVESRRADFLLTKFSSDPDMGAETDGIKLIPVPGIKIALEGSRHFVVSKNAPDAEAIFRALQKGLRALRADGIISKAYIESGFINPRVDSWNRIFP